MDMKMRILLVLLLAFLGYIYFNNDTYESSDSNRSPLSSDQASVGGSSTPAPPSPPASQSTLSPSPPLPPPPPPPPSQYQPTCEDFQCPAGWKYKGQPNRTNIVAPTVYSDEKRDKCCQKISCYNFFCPSGWKKKVNARSITVVRPSEYSEEKRDLCCDRDSWTCQDYTCGKNWFRKPQGAGVETRKINSITESETNNLACCLKKQKCAQHICPTNKQVKDPNKYCQTNKCTSGIDDSTCCENVPEPEWVRYPGMPDGMDYMPTTKMTMIKRRQQQPRTATEQDRKDCFNYCGKEASLSYVYHNNLCTCWKVTDGRGCVTWNDRTINVSGYGPTYMKGVKKC